MRLTNAAHFIPRQFFYRGGAEVARGAHNSEDIGSRPISGIVKLDAINAAHFKPLPRRTFYRLTSTLLTSKPRWSESRMVIFFLIKRTMWDRYLQVVIVKLDTINAATPKPRHDLSRIVSFHRHGAEAARGAHNSEVTGSKPVAGKNHINTCCLYYLHNSNGTTRTRSQFEGGTNEDDSSGSAGVI